MADAHNPNDPRGWLPAAPELASFLSDPRVAAAVERGDAERLHDALVARRKGPRGVFERKAIDALLARRRLFTSPVGKAPRLYTLNGFGTRIYGKSDVASDGSYIGTLFVTALYLPVFPLAQYLMHQAGHQYTFFGRVPLSGTLRVWRASVAMLAVLALVLGGAALWLSASRARVWFANGLDLPVEVAAGPVALQVAPRGLAAGELPTGRQKVKTRSADGRIIEELEIDVPRWTDAVVYNVLGAAPVYAEQVVYREKAPEGQQAPGRVDLLAGRSFVARDGVDFAFVDPPRQIRSKAKGNVVRWHVAVAEGGWRNTADWLAQERRGPEAAALAAAVAAAEKGNDDALEDAVRAGTLATGSEGGLAVSRRAIEADPGWIEAHRAHQHFLLMTGRREDALRFYRERAEREPASAAAAYLRARVEVPGIRMALYQDLVARHPSDPWARRGLAWLLLVSGRYADAVAQYQALARLDPKLADSLLFDEAYALVSLGRVRQAAARVAAGAEAAKQSLSTALLYARVARLRGSGAPHPTDHYLRKIQGEPWVELSRRAWVAALLGGKAPSDADLQKIESPPLRAGLGVLAAAGDPREALRRAAAAPVAALQLVGPELLVLLAGEALRSGDAASDRLLAALHRIEAPPSAVRDWIQGRVASPAFEVDPEIASALTLARARAAQAAGRPSAALYRVAAAQDRIPGIASRALAAWPRP